MADDADLASVWNETTQKARKPHKCGECGREIEPGELYVRVWAIGSEGPFQGKWCAHCDVGKDWLWENCSGSLLGGVIEDLEEHVRDYRGRAVCVPRLHRICIGAARSWRVERGPRAGQLMPIPVLPAKLEPQHHD